MSLSPKVCPFCNSDVEPRWSGGSDEDERFACPDCKHEDYYSYVVRYYHESQALHSRCFIFDDGLYLKINYIENAFTVYERRTNLKIVLQLPLFDISDLTPEQLHRKIIQYACFS